MQSSPTTLRSGTPQGDYVVAEALTEATLAEGPKPEPVFAEETVPADELVVAQSVAERRPAPTLGGILRTAWRGFWSAVEWLIGVATLIVGLAVLATLPVLNVLSLGYLLEVSGRIARTGKLRNGFIGVRKAARLGTLVLGSWLCLLPLRLMSSAAEEANLIEPGGQVARRWTMLLWIATAVLVAHIVGAALRGGRLRHFLWPRPIKLARQLFRRGGYTSARDAVWDFVTGLHLPYYFWLGLRGFAGGLVWLAIPITLMFLGATRQIGFFSFLGALPLMLVVLYLPFAQTRFAVENRFRAMFELGAIREHFRRAPVFFWLAVLFTLALAIPLYLLKIEIVPREAAWLPSLFFVIFIFPARFITGWAYSYAMRRPQRRHWFFRVTARFGMLPLAAIYVLFVWLTQFTNWYGAAGLYEQHAFLLPVPFLNM